MEAARCLGCPCAPPGHITPRPECASWGGPNPPLLAALAQGQLGGPVCGGTGTAGGNTSSGSEKSLRGQTHAGIAMKRTDTCVGPAVLLPRGWFVL